ncbi:MAG: hypothetical protein Ta2F_06840 [Termitinemataceae bacterium]|nr:MAG: hypothetical protein Ta2F_06840 [Termitinemataceae bacterium]
MRSIRGLALTALIVVSMLLSLSAKEVGNGQWGAKEVQTVCSELLESCLTSPAVDRVVKAKTKGTTVPTVIVGQFPNQSSEYLDTSIVAEKMETAIINDGRLSFVAGGDVRENLRGERNDQQSNASEKTAKALGNETAADFMLNGSVKLIVSRVKDKATRTYTVFAQITNIETNVIIWKGNSDVVVNSKGGKTVK